MSVGKIMLSFYDEIDLSQFLGIPPKLPVPGQVSCYI